MTTIALAVTDQQQFGPNDAQMTITWGGQCGDLRGPVPYEATDDDLLNMATEALRTGFVDGMAPDEAADLAGFVVDRFPAVNDGPNPRPYPRVSIRSKTPFGVR